MGRYKRLVTPTTQEGKEQLFLNCNFYDFKQSNCRKIPGQPIVYWISDNFINNFAQKAFNDIADLRVGLDTGNNEKFLRLWFEPSYQQLEFNATSSSSYIVFQKKNMFLIQKEGNIENGMEILSMLLYLIP